MRYVDNRHSLFFVERSRNFHDLSSALRIEHRSRLVHNQNFGFDCNRPRNGYSLLLSAREFRNFRFPELFHIRGFERTVYRGGYFLPRHRDVFRSERDIVLDDRRDLLIVGILKNHSRFFSYFKEVAFLRGVKPENEHLARRGLQKSVHEPRERAFSASVPT